VGFRGLIPIRVQNDEKPFGLSLPAPGAGLRSFGKLRLNGLEWMKEEGLGWASGFLV